MLLLELSLLVGVGGVCSALECKLLINYQLHINYLRTAVLHKEWNGLPIL